MCKEWAGAQVNKREATGMCEKVALKSMLPIMRMKVDVCVKVEAASQTRETRAETSERGLPTNVWGWFQGAKRSDRLHSYEG